MPFRTKFSKADVAIREEIIIKYLVSLIKDVQNTPALKSFLPYGFEYGIIDWSWPTRYAKGNHEFKPYKYYSYKARDAVLSGDEKFTRDHFVPRRIFKDILYGLEEPTYTSVRRLMEMYGEICVITKEEDKALNLAGLNRAMPAGWKKGDNAFSRYDQIGIQVWENDRLW